MSERPDEQVVYTTKGANGAQYDVVSWTAVGQRAYYEVRRSGGVGPSGAELPPQNCGTYYSKTAAVNRATDLVIFSASFHREVAKQQARKAKQRESPP